MALYDDKMDWYDVFVPGSQLVPLWSNAKTFVNGLSDPVNSESKLANFITGESATNSQYVKNLALQHDAQAFNSAESAKERDWQTQMRDSSITSTFKQYQDLGLNPLLALQGSGSSSASMGSSASSNASEVSKPSGGFENTIKGLGSAALIMKFAKMLVK
ncbi:minor capsid protein [Capybara microvirus Cap3_SP_468]|nr:minor capsid protein [Capybara microvirus Cap3_SP_468]